MLILQFEPFPILETERLILQRFERGHFENMFELRSNDEVMRYVERPRPVSVDEMEAFLKTNDELLEKKEGIAWVIMLKEPSVMVGTIGFWRMKKEHYRAEIGYMLLPQYWKKGIMGEAMNAVLSYAFDKMKLHSVEADINPDNEASAAILERFGFIREAFFRENFYWKGVFLNSAIYSLLEHDYRTWLLKKH